MSTPSEAHWRKRRKKPFLVRHWRAYTIPLAILAMAVTLRVAMRPRGPVEHHLAGYISNSAVLVSEYAHFQGKPLKAIELQQQFEQAAQLVRQGDFFGAAGVLEPTAKAAPVPVIFNDLGVLYAQLNDRSRAVNAFREALARDGGYRPVRQNMERLKGFTSNLADPVSTEVEPNDSIPYANLIAADRPVEAEIKDTFDQDYFRLTTPPAPRDRLEISVRNHSATLIPRLRFYDEDGIILPLGNDRREPGESIVLVTAPPPNTTWYLAVSGSKGTAGAYTLLVKTLKSFDRYEPNDEVYSASRIAAGQAIQANIMDGDDTDFYSFESPRTGIVSIEIVPRSNDLTPALTTFSPDMRTSGFAPNVDHPGATLRHTISVEAGLTYYIQVWAQARTIGEYTLTVQ